jgi:hypothetical protein
MATSNQASDTQTVGHFLVGATGIARALGCSAKTVTRVFHAGQLTGAFKLPGRGRNTPIRISRHDLAKLRNGAQGRPE